MRHCNETHNGSFFELENGMYLMQYKHEPISVLLTADEYKVELIMDRLYDQPFVDELPQYKDLTAKDY